MKVADLRQKGRKFRRIAADAARAGNWQEVEKWEEAARAADELVRDRTGRRGAPAHATPEFMRAMRAAKQAPQL